MVESVQWWNAVGFVDGGGDQVCGGGYLAFLEGGYAGDWGEVVVCVAALYIEYASRI